MVVEGTEHTWKSTHRFRTWDLRFRHQLTVSRFNLQIWRAIRKDWNCQQLQIGIKLFEELIIHNGHKRIKWRKYHELSNLPFYFHFTHILEFSWPGLRSQSSHFGGYFFPHIAFMVLGLEDLVSSLKAAKSKCLKH